MPTQDLARFASGIAKTFFGGMLQDRQTEKEEKDRELVRQLAAYHALLEHPDTPEADIPDILDAQAKLLKGEKDFAPITAHMREAMKRQVPYGPERETGQSISDRVIARGSGSPEATTELATSVPQRPTAANPTGMATASAPMTVITPAVLPRVPEEPQMYQPVREYGTLTQGEALDARKSDIYGRQQEDMMRRQLKIQDQADEGRAERERIRADSARTQEELRQKGRIAVVQKTYEEKGKLLGPAAMAKIEAPRVAYENSLIAGGMNENDAKAASYRLFQAQMDVDLAAKKQKIEESKERMKRMGVQNAESWERIRKSKTTTDGLYGGMSANAKREFDLRTGTLQNQMTSVLRQLEALYRKRDDEGPDAVRQETIDALENQKADLWVNIDAVRNEMLTRQAPSVPGVPGTQRTPARVGKDPLGLFQ